MYIQMNVAPAALQKEIHDATVSNGKGKKCLAISRHL